MSKITTASTQHSPLKGIAICLLSYFFMSFIGIFEKPLSPNIPLTTILFFQSFSCLLLIVFHLRKHPELSLKPANPLAYGVRIAAGLGCYGLLFYLIRFMPLSIALLYQYTGALWVPFVMLLWLNTRMPKKLWWGILIGFAGITLILKPTPAAFSLVSLLGILCGILQALTVVAVRKLSTTEPTLRILFYYFLIGTLVLSPLLIKHWTAIGLRDALLLAAIGVSTYLAQVFFTLSSKYADPATLAPICYTSILYSGLIGWLVWHEIPESMTLLGMGLVIMGCLLTILINHPRLSSKTY